MLTFIVSEYGVRPEHSNIYSNGYKLLSPTVLNFLPNNIVTLDIGLILSCPSHDFIHIVIDEQYINLLKIENNIIETDIKSTYVLTIKNMTNDNITIDKSNTLCHFYTKDKLFLHDTKINDYYKQNSNIILQSVTDPIVESVSEPVVEPIVEHVAESVAEPVAEPIVEHVAESVAESVAEPVVEHVAEPIVEQVAEPGVEHVAEPVVEHVAEPVVEHVAEPSVIPSVEAINKEAPVEAQVETTTGSAVESHTNNITLVKRKYIRKKHTTQI
jgi:hypothetical protein